MSISLKIVNRKNKSYYITNKVKSVTWSGDYQQACRKLDFVMVTNKKDKDLARYDIKEGYMVFFYEDKKELFRGFVYAIDRGNDEITYNCYDHAQKLCDINVSFNFKEKTAKQIAIQCLKKYNIPYDAIIDDKIEYSKVFIDVSMYDTIMSAYTNAHKSNKKEYMIYSSKGKINVAEKGKIKLELKFKEGENILTSSYKSSIENIKNKVLIVDSKGNVVDKVENKKSKELYGLFQAVYKQEESETSSTETTDDTGTTGTEEVEQTTTMESIEDSKEKAKAMLQSRERSVSLEGYGDTTCITGYGVTVEDASTNLKGLFYIDTDSHTWEGGEYKVSLNLNFKNIMNEVEAGEDEEEESVDGLGGVGKVLNGKKVKAKFTAYYPHNDSMEGGFYTATGEKATPSKHTCAVPHSPFVSKSVQIEYGTKIQPSGTGTKIDGVTYRANDCGEAIVIKNGVYNIDILMSSKAECNAFGVRNGYIIIGDGTGYKQVSNYSSGSGGSAKAKAALKFALSKVGGPYVLGGNGPRAYDCSGLVHYAYAHVGISVPRTAMELGSVGHAVNFNNLQAGDIVTFKTMGKSYTTHVGMYIGNGKFVHASSPSSGIKISNFSDKIDRYGHTYRWEVTHCRRVV